MGSCELWLMLFLSLVVAFFCAISLFKYCEKFNGVKLTHSIKALWKMQPIALASVILCSVYFNYAFFTKKEYTSHGEITLLGNAIVYSHCEDKKEETQEEDFSDSEEVELVVAKVFNKGCLGG